MVVLLGAVARQLLPFLKRNLRAYFFGDLPKRTHRDTHLLPVFFLEQLLDQRQDPLLLILVQRL